MHKYLYKLAKYIHDPVREESVNVGILFYAPGENIIKFRARKNLKDLRVLFPHFKYRELQDYLKNLEIGYSAAAAELKDMLCFKELTINEIAHKILSVDDSSMQWGKFGSGISDNLDDTFEKLSNRFVQQDPSLGGASGTRSDAAVWREFSKELKRRNLLSYFKHTTINIGGFSEDLEHTYQNGQLHCLKPLSLDLTTEEGIKDKVYKEAGRYKLVHESKLPNLKFYYLLGKPNNPEFNDDFENAKKLLQSVGGDDAVFTEDQASILSDLIEKSINHTT